MSPSLILLGKLQLILSRETQPAPSTRNIFPKPGWFATHWYWLGLIPVAWGVWQLLWLLIIVLSLNGQIMEPAFGGMEIITSGNAFLIN